jgi:hypothetical protein
MAAWKDDIVTNREAVSAVYSYASQGNATVTNALKQIMTMAQAGIDRLTAIKAEAQKCLDQAANPHLDNSQHGAPATPTRLEALASIARAFSRLQEGLNVSRLYNAGTPLGCQQELEHPGGGDVGLTEERPSAYGGTSKKK